MPPETAEEKLVVMTPTMAATTAARMPRMLMNGRNPGRHFDHFSQFFIVQVGARS